MNCWLTGSTRTTLERSAATNATEANATTAEMERNLMEEEGMERRGRIWLLEWKSGGEGRAKKKKNRPRRENLRSLYRQTTMSRANGQAPSCEQEGSLFRVVFNPRCHPLSTLYVHPHVKAILTFRKHNASGRQNNPAVVLPTKESWPLELTFVRQNSEGHSLDFHKHP